MSGEHYFILASTWGGGSLIELPVDVRRLIYEWTFPRIKARCEHCDRIVLVESIHHAYCQAQPFTVRDNAYWCMNCKYIPITTKSSVPSFWSTLRMFALR